VKRHNVPIHVSMTWLNLRLCAVMVAACGFAAAGEAEPGGGVAGDAAAAQALRDYAAEAEKHGAGREVAAAYHFEEGKRALSESRLEDAVRSLGIAVDYMPDKQEYQDALAQAQAIAGHNRDHHSVTVVQIADELTVEQQQLWIEAQQKIEDGTSALEAGDYAEAERLFSMAHIRLESLPFADERKEPEQRRVESLIAEARKRRAQQEMTEATQANQSASERSQALTRESQKIERDRIDAMFKRALKARERRDYDEAILLSEQILKINRAEERAHDLLVRCRRERHIYLRQVTADRWDEEHKLLSEKMRTEMLPQMELLTYSHDWPEIDARRGAPVRGLAEEDEEWRKNINAQLEQEVTLDFQDNDLVETINFLQRITGVNIVIDPEVIAAAPPPVTLKVDAMKLRNVLDFIMRLTSLNYVLRDEAIFISNEAGLRGEVYMKLYDIRDLTHGMTAFPGPELDIPQPGEEGSRLLPPVEDTAPPELNEFIEIIRGVVAPATWETDGVAIEEFGGSMVITQSATVHKQVDELLRSLRNQQGLQIHVKVKFLNVENSLLEEIGVNWNQYGRVPGNPSVFPPAVTAPPAGVNPNLASTQGVGLVNADSGSSVAAALNTPLQSYTTGGLTLGAPQPGEGGRFQTQVFHLSDGLYASAILTAIEKERRGNILFEPDLTLFNGQQAHLVNMNQQSYVADYDVVQSQYDPIVSILSYGTVLDVQAVASADRKYITLTLRPTNAQVRQWRRFGPPINSATNPFPGATGSSGGVVNPPNNFAIAGGNPILMPELIYQAVRTSVIIPDGGSLMIAGFNNAASQRAHSGIPFLSHIPFLGRLFSRNGRAETELSTLIMVSADLILFDEIEDSL